VLDIEAGYLPQPGVVAGAEIDLRTLAVQAELHRFGSLRAV
jgi:hypothetical protein